MTARVLAFRHAPVVDAGLCYGRADVAVTLSVDETARTIIDAIHSSQSGADRVWSSPAKRCADPAAIVARELGVPHQVDDRLSELGFGDWEGRPWAEIEAGDGARLREWMEAWQTARPPGGETVAELEHRVREWLGTLGSGETHVLVAHAGAIRALWVITGVCDWRGAMGREVEHLGAISLLGVSGHLPSR